MYLRTKAILFSVVLISCGAENDPLREDVGVIEEITSLPYYDSPDFMPVWKTNEPDTLHNVADFSFTSHTGEVISKETVKNKIYLVNFFFSACGGICPKMMRNMETVQNAFASNADVLFISHTVTPWADSVAVLNKYATNFNVIENKWHLVTGDKAEIYNLARTSYFVEEEPGFTKDSTEFLHTEHFVLVDRKGHLRGLYNGTLELEMERVIEDIHLLLKEE